MMRDANAPQPVADCPTKRFDLRALDVQRMFDAAEVDEVVQEATAALAEAQADMLRDLVVRLAISFC